MRFISIAHAKPGMVLAEGIFDAWGHKLVGKDNVLTKMQIDRLRELGFVGVYIDDSLSKDIKIEPVISQMLRLKGMESVRNCDVDACQKVACMMVEEIMEKESISFDMMDLRSFDCFTHAHSVNVAAISSVIGMGLNLPERDMENLATAALLHDLGKISIPLEVLNKPGRLTGEEYQLIKSHVQRSYDLIRDRWDISATVKAAVYLHHENEDGSGYPQGLTGSEISLFAKIIHVADVYDALISNRPYKSPYTPYEAAEYLMGSCGILFDQNVVQMLLNYVPLYPKGTEVTLSDGNRGIVYDNFGIHNLRPAIYLESGRELDLTAKENLNITINPPDSVELEVREKSEAARKEMIRKSKCCRIMVVDDMKTNLQAIREMLGDFYDLKLMKSGRQALLYLEKNEWPELILMDINMPEMDGIETAKQIRKIAGDKIPILFVSSICDRTTVMQCKEVNAASYIIRPFESDYLRKEIQRVLQK